MPMASFSQLLIIGGSGFLGWHLVKTAAAQYDVSWTHCQHALNIAESPDSYRLDIQQPDEVRAVIEQVEPEVIIHTSAMTNADLCETHRSLAHSLNVDGTRNVAECAEEVGAKLIYISTDLVFDGLHGNYRERSATKPVNYYGETKLAGERVVKEVMSKYLIVRVALMYGNSNSVHGCFTDWMRNGLQQRHEVTLFTDQYRTPLFVNDAAQAILELAEKSPENETYHLGGSERLNRYEFGLKFCQIFGYDPKYLRAVTMNDIPSLVPRGADCSLNNHKAQKLLSFTLSDAASGLEKMRRELR